MAELYWRALTRDVPFREYESYPLVAAAVTDLNAFSEPLTSGSGEKPTPATVFRGESRSDVIGPYLSQFLWLEVPYGIKTIEQRYAVPSRGQLTHRLRRMARLPARRHAAIDGRVRCDAALHLQRARACRIRPSRL